MKPPKGVGFRVWWKRQGEWKKVFSSYSPFEASLYAYDKIRHGGITERIELREAGGEVVDVIYDRSWV